MAKECVSFALEMSVRCLAGEGQTVLEHYHSHLVVTQRVVYVAKVEQSIAHHLHIADLSSYQNAQFVVMQCKRTFPAGTVCNT